LPEDASRHRDPLCRGRPSRWGGLLKEALGARLQALPHVHFTWRDAVDILVVAAISYFLLRLIRGTRAVQMVLGIVTVFLMYEAAAILKLVAVRTVLEALLFYLPFAIIVVFAPELRRALA